MANYFTDRVVEHPGRVRLTPVSGEANVYDMEREEGAVTETGTPFSADEFNGIAQDILDKIATGGKGLKVGTCTTATSTATKEVTLPDFTLETNAVIGVIFSNMASPTTQTVYLNVNGTGAKRIVTGLVHSLALQTGTFYSGDVREAWSGKDLKLFFYTGTYWYLINPDVMSYSELEDLEDSLNI